MKHKVVFTSAVSSFLALTVLFASPVFAKKAAKQTLEQTQLERIPAEEAQNSSSETLQGITEKVSGKTSEEKARNFLNQRQNAKSAQESEVKPELFHTDTLTTDGGDKVRFSQKFLSIPIYHSSSVVNVNAGGEVDFASLEQKTFGMSKVESKAFLAKKISKRKAIQLVRAYLKMEHPQDWVKIERMIYASTAKPILVYVVRLSSSEDRLYDWEVLVNAKTGQIIRAQSKSNDAAGSAMVYDPNPIVESGLSYGTGGIVDGNGADTTALTNLRKKVELAEITQQSGGFMLKSQYAEIVDIESPKLGLYLNKTSAFECLRSQKCFQAANAFYFIHQSMKYINETLKIPCKPYQYTGGVKFDPQGVNGDDNSHYIGETGALAFGEGGVDDAEDHDVVLHELGHAIHDFMTRGHLSQVNGLSEGVGDYWTTSYVRGLGKLKPTAPAYNWVFTWDGHNNYWPGRITNYKATYPGGLVNQVHSDGQMWASTLMLIWDELGKTVTDTLLLEGLAMTTNSTNQQDAAAAMIKADMNIYKGAHAEVLRKHFKARGYQLK